MKNRIDMHTHTDHSFDAEARLSEYEALAAEGGFLAFAVTDHCDVNAQPLSEARQRITGSGRDVLRAREGKPFEILLGIELGEPLEDPAYAEEILSLFDYDYLLGSIHNTPGNQDFYFMDCSTIDLAGVLKPYFEELCRFAEWGQFDALAHCTYPLRYIEGKYKRPVDLTPYEDLIDELFQKLIQKDRTLEINTSGLRQGLNRPMPDERFLKRYYQLGGRRITFGSDCHRAADFGAGISECVEIARKIGFTEATYYRGRIPQTIPLAD